MTELDKTELGNIFIDNEYFNIYSTLLDRALHRTPEAGVTYQYHHNVPRCYYKKYGDPQNMQDSGTNLSILTLEEHIIAHLLMSRCMKDSYLARLMVGGADALSRGQYHQLYERPTGNIDAFIERCNLENKK